MIYRNIIIIVFIISSDRHFDWLYFCDNIGFVILHSTNREAQKSFVWLPKKVRTNCLVTTSFGICYAI